MINFVLKNYVYGKTTPTDAVDMNLGKLREMMRDREAWGALVHGVERVGYDRATEQDSIKSKKKEKRNFGHSGSRKNMKAINRKLL